MRRFIIGAFIAGVALAGGYAAAQIVPALPFQLQNGTVADAAQVMANFNQILNNVNTHAAKNGTNSDITRLVGLTTPLAPSVGGTNVYSGGTSGGSGNAQTITSTVPSYTTPACGQIITFKAGATNTGQMTLNVQGIGARTVTRMTQLSEQPLVGGEIAVGSTIMLIDDCNGGYQIVGHIFFIGEVKDYIGTVAPSGWAVADGSCISQTAYGALFALASTTWGACGAGLFALPDYRGRYGVGKDGGTGRITTTCAGGNTLATGCGAQNTSVSVAKTNLPTYDIDTSSLGVSLALTRVNTLAVGIGTLAVSDTRTWQTANSIYSTGASGARTAGTEFSLTATQQSVTVANAGTIGLTGSPALTGDVTLAGSGGIGSPSASLTGTLPLGGSGTAITVPTLSPSIVVNKIIKL